MIPVPKTNFHSVTVKLSLNLNQIKLKALWLHSLLQRQHVRPRDRVSVYEGEELLEDAEEGPVRQNADALLDLHAAVGDGPAVHDAQQTQTHTLPLGQRLAWVRLVELDRCTVHLNTQSCDHIIDWSRAPSSADTDVLVIGVNGRFYPV